MTASVGAVRIGPARAGDLPAMEQVCIDTADQGHDPRPVRRMPELLPAIWLTPYMAPDADTVCLVARRDAPSHVAGAETVGRSDILGYCIASRDARAFAERLAGDMWASAAGMDGALPWVHRVELTMPANFPDPDTPTHARYQFIAQITANLEVTA